MFGRKTWSEASYRYWYLDTPKYELKKDFTGNGVTPCFLSVWDDPVCWPHLFICPQAHTAPCPAAHPMSTSVEGRSCASTWANCATGSQTAPAARTREPTAEVTAHRRTYSSSNIQCVCEKLQCSCRSVWNFEQTSFLLSLLSYGAFLSSEICTVWSLSELPVAPRLFKYWVELFFFPPVFEISASLFLYCFPANPSVP